MVIATASDEGHPLERYRRTWELHGSWSYPFISQKLETHQNLEVFEEKTNQQNATTRRRPVPWSEYPHQFCCSSSINMKQKKTLILSHPLFILPPRNHGFLLGILHISWDISGRSVEERGMGSGFAPREASQSSFRLWNPTCWTKWDDETSGNMGHIVRIFSVPLSLFLCSHTWTLLEFLGRMDDLLWAAGPSHWITGPDFSSRTCNFRRKLNGQISLVTIRNLGGS